MKEQPSSFISAEMKKHNYSDDFSKEVMQSLTVVTSEAFVMSEVEISGSQKKQISWFITAMGNRTVETESLFMATIIIAILNPPDFDKDQLVGEYSTEDTIMHLLWMFNVGYTAKMFVLGQLNVETKEKLTKGLSLTVNQWFALKDLLVKTLDGKTQTTPANMAKAIYKTVFKSSTTHFDFVHETPNLKEKPDMSINIEPTPAAAPEEKKHPFYKVFYEDSTPLAFNEKWSDGTGYFNNACEGPEAPVLDFKDYPVRSTDDQGRKILMFHTNFGNVVIFERYPNGENGVIVSNVPHAFDMKYHIFQGHVHPEEFLDLVNVELRGYLRKETPVQPAKTEDTFTCSTPIPAEEYCAEDPIPETTPTPKEDKMPNEKPDDWKFHPTNDQGTYNKKPIVEEVPTEAKPEEEKPVVEKPWYKKPIVIGTVVASAVVVAGGIWYGLRK